ncbi:MAG: cellulose binding domain-containing protein [Exilibacterium sp.]
MLCIPGYLDNFNPNTLTSWGERLINGVDVSGTQPWTASNLSWNAVINPGQSVEFGFIGNGGGQASAVTGDVCD